MSFDENLISNPSKGMPRLLEIMRALRDPESGCPWDIEQNFKTIAPYTVEEAYEVADAIERENWDDLKNCLLYTSPSPRDLSTSRMPSSA